MAESPGAAEAREVAQAILQTFGTRRQLLAWLDHTNLDTVLYSSPVLGGRTMNQSQMRLLAGALAIAATGRHRDLIGREFRLSAYPLLQAVGQKLGA